MVLRARPSFSQRLSAKRSRSPALASEGAFMLQEPALDAALESLAALAHEPAEVAAGGDDAMARDHDRDRIRAARSADRTRRGTDLARNLAIGARDRKSVV